MPLVSFCSPYSIIKTRWSRFVDYCPNLHCQWGSLRQEILTPSFFKFLGCSVVGMKSCRLKWFPEVGTLNGPKGKVTFDSEAQFPPEVLSLNMPPLNAAIDLRGVKVSFVRDAVIGTSCSEGRHRHLHASFFIKARMIRKMENPIKHGESAASRNTPLPSCKVYG